MTDQTIQEMENETNNLLEALADRMNQSEAMQDRILERLDELDARLKRLYSDEEYELLVRKWRRLSKRS